MNIVIITPSKNKLKKFDATINGIKTVSFGQAGASDFTQHHDDVRQRLYIIRHRKNERWDDPLTSGFYSRWLLWNKKSLRSSIDDMNERFKKLSFYFKIK